MNPTNPQLNLIVIRSPYVEELVRFYTLLGLTFQKHKHGKGPEHWGAAIGEFYLEIYPQLDYPSTRGTRLGFKVANVHTVCKALQSVFPACIVNSPKSSEWGLRAIVKDPEGHRIELLDNSLPDGITDADRDAAEDILLAIRNDAL